MRIYTNVRVRRGPFGGANAFMRSLMRVLRCEGVSFTNTADRSVDLCLLNALSERLTIEDVREVAKLGRPIVHRKVGYAVSGGPEMRRVHDGVVWGDKLQIDFAPYIEHSIFQSEYSRDTYLAEGFEGPFTVIRNGVDETLFNMQERRFLGTVRRPRPLWDGIEPFRLVISSWSSDVNKGFPEYERIDSLLGGRDDVQITFVGNIPDGCRFRNIRVVPPQPHRKLARFLKRQHALLTLARKETCSNALLEGLNCGLPVIYLDSGANRECADPYGVEYKGDIFAAVAGIKHRYRDYVKRIPDNPYRISLVADRYLTLFRSMLDSQRPARS